MNAHDATAPIPVALAGRALPLERGDRPTPPPAGDEVALRQVSVAALRIDPAYQRKITKRGTATIRRIVQEFTWSRFGALTVAADAAEEAFAVTDGQHRAIAAWILGLETVPAIVCRIDTPGQARDFLSINLARTGMQATDKFRARVAAGDPPAVRVDDMLRNFEISYNLPPGVPLKHRQTMSVSTIEKLARRHGYGTVGTALETLLDAQPDTPDLLSSFAIEVAVLLTDRVLETEGDLDRLDTILAETDFDTLKESARSLLKHMGGRAARHGADMLRRAYNKGLRQGNTI